MGFVTNTQLKQVEQTLVENIKNGIMKVGHSEVADNLTPYSADSGTAQENPFISQGTGTNNNTEIVTVGDYGLLKSKNGNTVVVNQLIPTAKMHTTFTLSEDKESTGWGDTVVRIPMQDKIGHKVLAFIKTTNPIKASVHWGANTNRFADGQATVATNKQFGAYEITSQIVGSSANTELAWRYYSGATAGTYEADIFLIDLTQWYNGNDNIPADLLAHPEHFSWYYNGDLSYNAGTLVNATGRYLECGQGRNLLHYDNETLNVSLNNAGTTYADNTRNTSDYILITPGLKYYLKSLDTSGSYVEYCYYDKDKNFIKHISATNSYSTAPDNAIYVRICYNKNNKNSTTFSFYYTPEQGGEGYDQYYPYEAPHVVDTGSEELLAFDKKTPDGTIQVNTGEYTFTGNESWAYNSTINRWYVNNMVSGANAALTIHGEKPDAILSIATSVSWNSDVYSYKGWQISGRTFYYKDPTNYPRGTSPASLFVVGTKLQYKLATPTTEQGTSFSENLPINDYGMMYWDDDVPQGVSIFYPINYKGFLDDLYSRVSGDSSEYALESDISDTALAERGYYKMQDLSSEITDVAGLTYSIKKLVLTGNIATLTIKAKNATGSEISASTNLFSIPANVAPSTQLNLCGCIANDSLTLLALAGQSVYCTRAIPNNAFVSMSVSWVVA